MSDAAQRVRKTPDACAYWTRRFVFSSSGDQTRARSSKIASKGLALPQRVRSAVTVAAESLFTTLFPADCRICNIPLTNISKLPVCEECIAAIHPLNGGLCSICGERLLSPFLVADDVRCGLCRRIEAPYQRALAYGSYEGGLRELIHLLKYDRVRPAANVLGRMLNEVIASLEPGFSNHEILLIPVPLHKAKQRQREFNQAEIIARATLKLMQSKQYKLRSDLLIRCRATQSQIGLSSHQRRKNMRGAFAIMAPEQIKNREILLVDDVFTTGTTVSECARILRRAEASKVWVATVARTLKFEAQTAKPQWAFDEAKKMAAAG